MFGLEALSKSARLALVTLSPDREACDRDGGLGVGERTPDGMLGGIGEGVVKSSGRLAMRDECCW